MKIIDDIKEKWRAFWNDEMLKRPLVVAHVPKNGEYINYTTGKNYNLINNDVDAFLNSVDKMLEANLVHGRVSSFFCAGFRP